MTDSTATPHSTQYYTYILRCEDGTLYTGITTSISRRFSEHKRGGSRAAKYTRSRKPAEMAAAWVSDSRMLASRLEYRIKRLTRAQKLELISGGDLQSVCESLETEMYSRVSVENISLPQ